MRPAPMKSALRWFALAAAVVFLNVSTPAVPAGAHHRGHRAHSNRASHAKADKKPHARAHANPRSPRASRSRNQSSGSVHPVAYIARPQQSSFSSSASSSTASSSNSTAKKKSKKRRSKREPTQKAPTPERISEIQSALARGGYYQGDPTGKWDAKTVGAMQKFQADNGIEPNGKLDALSLQKLGLGSEIAGVSAPKAPSPPSCCASSQGQNPSACSGCAHGSQSSAPKPGDTAGASADPKPPAPAPDPKPAPAPDSKPPQR